MTMKTLLVLFAVCAIAAAGAMLPREKRALNDDEEPRSPPPPPPPTTSGPSTSTTTTTAKPKEVCLPDTSCLWAIYDSTTLRIYSYQYNTYCECGEGKVCTRTRDDKTVYSYFYYCRLPSEADDSIVES